MAVQCQYVEPQDFPQYHQCIRDHEAKRQKMAAAIAHHKQVVWEKELAVTLEYREHHKRWQEYFYSITPHPPLPPLPAAPAPLKHCQQQSRQ